ncbi:MAG: hypothetical protein ACI9H8_001792 [Lysobacterales bacterium]|jgi:hypothetical protein
MAELKTKVNDQDVVAFLAREILPVCETVVRY